MFLILLAIFLWMSMKYSANSQKTQKLYSIFNKGENGISVFYETLKELEYPVKLVTSEISKQNKSVQIVAMPNSSSVFNINDMETKKWIEKGGSLIYLTDKLDEINVEYGNKLDTYGVNEKEMSIVYEHGKGCLIVGDTNLISNRVLTENTEGAYWLLNQIDKLEYESVGFNEYYKYIDVEKPSLWKDTPSEIRIIIFQIILFVLTIIYYNGKRFGKPVPLYEEVERTENEFIYAVAALYKMGKCKETVLLSFYDDFVLNAATYFESDIDTVKKRIIELWEKEQLTELSKLKRVHNFMLKETINDRKISSKKMMDIVLMIEHLNKILEKRRETRWIAMKK